MTSAAKVIDAAAATHALDTLRLFLIVRLRACHWPPAPVKSLTQRNPVFSLLRLSGSR